MVLYFGFDHCAIVMLPDFRKKKIKKNKKIYPRFSNAVLVVLTALLHGNLSVERAWLGGYCGVVGRFLSLGTGSVKLVSEPGSRSVERKFQEKSLNFFAQIVC